MHVLILANGVPPPAGLLEQLISEADLFLATDGAANLLNETILNPHIVLGDFDSITEEARSRHAAANFIHATDQEASDLDKALDHAVGLGATRITITGALGGRIDHALTAMSLLIKYGSQIHIRVVENAGELMLLSDEVVLSGCEGDTVSIIVFDTIHGVSTEGLAWPLDNETLHPGSRGVSNRLAASRARITIREGRAIVCHLRSTR